MSIIKRGLIALFVSAATVGSAQATDYRFHVSCAARNHVVQWSTGDLDPGREYLRVATGLLNPGCGITDYDPRFDASLPVDRLSDWSAVLQGSIPVLGLLLGGLLAGG